jgi:hypothetical protein
MSQILSMAQRLQESERIVADLRAALDRISATGPPPTFPQPRGDVSATEDPPYDDVAGGSGLDHGTSTGVSANPDDALGSERRLLSDLSLDEQGKVGTVVLHF